MTTKQQLESEIRDRVQAKVDSGSPLDANALRKSALEDLIDLGSDAGGYLGAGGSYSGSEEKRLTKQWIALLRLAKAELKQIEVKLS